MMHLTSQNPETNLPSQHHKEEGSQIKAGSRWQALVAVKENIAQATSHAFKTFVFFITAGFKSNENVKRSWSQTLQYVQLTWVCLRALFGYKATFEVIPGADDTLPDLIDELSNEAIFLQTISANMDFETFKKDHCHYELKILCSELEKNYFNDLPLMTFVLSKCLTQSKEKSELQDKYCNHLVQKIKQGYEFEKVSDFRAVFDDLALYNNTLLLTCHLYILAHLHQLKELTEETVYGKSMHIMMSIHLFLEKFKSTPPPSRDQEFPSDDSLFFWNLGETTLVTPRFPNEWISSLAHSYEECFPGAASAFLDTEDVPHLLNICSYLVQFGDEECFSSMAYDYSDLNFIYTGPNTQSINLALMTLKSGWESAHENVRKNVKGMLEKLIPMNERGQRLISLEAES